MLHTTKKDSNELNELVTAGQLTKEGMGWLQEALNPFADFTVPPIGYPDATPGNSVVSRVTLTKAINVPAGQDLHVFTLPQLQPRLVGQDAFSSPTINALTGAAYGTLSLCNLVTTPTGSNTAPYYDAVTNRWIYAVPTTVDSFDINDYLVGSSRVVALGVEIINTTSELNKCGSLISYRAPQCLTNSQYTQAGDPAGSPGRHLYRSTLFPATPSQALQLPGSQQWEAAEGAYLTGTMCQVQNPIGQEDYIDQFYLPTFKLDGIGTDAVAIAPRVSGRFPTATVCAKTPWNTSGAYISGIITASSFSVVLRVVVENFPQPDQLLLMTQSRPACPYDALALQIYSEAVFQLPAGTQVGNNPNGEYWAVVKDVIKGVAPPAITRMLNVMTTGVKVAKAAKPVLDATKTFGKDVATLRQVRKK